MDHGPEHSGKAHRQCGRGNDRGSRIGCKWRSPRKCDGGRPIDVDTLDFGQVEKLGKRRLEGRNGGDGALVLRHISGIEDTEAP